MASAKPENNSQRGPRVVSLPGFLIEDDIGAGEMIKRATAAIGIKPCGGCGRRAAALDRRLIFTRQPR